MIPKDLMFTFKFGCAVSASVALLLIPAVLAQKSESGSVLPGHLLSDEAAISKSSDIAVVVLISAGRHDPGASTVEEYDNVKIAVEQVLKGTAFGDLICRYNRLEFPSPAPEVDPSLGNKYIVFLQYRGTQEGKMLYNVLRFAECDDKKVAEWRKLIASKM